MGINRKILKIIDRCKPEMVESAKFKELLTENYLAFKEPVTLDKLKEINLPVVVRETGSSQKSAQLAQRMIENIHKAESACIPSGSFI